MDDKLKKMLETKGIALVSINKDGSPHLIAVAYAKVVDDKIIITDNFMKTTNENIKRHPMILLAVWNDEFEGYRIEGTAEYYNDGKWLEFVKSLKENDGLPAKGAIVVTPKKIVRLS
ncbi:MAG: pyridoxamine 5'-phosphate oxidase family protein [Nanoarchaeota archaeon]|nr:pyridoxamine 5'-phosphate oxidase family protein [Nanoarchaeota archaeon]